MKNPDKKKALILASFLLVATLFFLLPRLGIVGHDPVTSFLTSQSQIQTQKKEELLQEGDKLGADNNKSSHNKRGDYASENSNSTRKEEEECNLFEGRWVWDERRSNEGGGHPLYESRDCLEKLQGGGFHCSVNGRPDRDYTKWWWQPNGCNLPRFDAKDMLERLRGKRVVFVGDSIGRNQWESLLCMLASAIPNKSSVYEVNGNLINKQKEFLAYKFRDYDATVEYYRAPFLVLQSRAPAGAPKKVFTTLKLDVLDYTANKWKGSDMLILNTGHWWSRGKTVDKGHYFQEGSKVKMEMSVESAYQRSIKTILEWIHREVNTSRTQVYFRTYAPVHFRFGDWKTGGSCHLETLPELNSSAVDSNSWSHYLSPFKELTSLKHSNRVPIREVELLNITYMTALRKDAHLSLYYLGPNMTAALHRQDCSHWCLPGVPDTWNEIIYALFLRRERAVHRGGEAPRGLSL